MRSTLMRLLLGMLFFALASTQASSQVPSNQAAALVALYNSTNGPGWTDSTGWLGLSGTECSWFGVTCDGGQVYRITLPYNNLSGTIPPELGVLTHLERLVLHHNNLSGAIPPELGGLLNVLFLELYYNDLSGSIPPELGDLPSVVEITLSHNKLDGGIPPELGDLPTMEWLDLRDNQLTGGIPPELGQVDLFSLELNNNHLSGDVPGQLANLTRLYDDFGLNLCWNDLSTEDQSLADFLDTKHVQFGPWQQCQVIFWDDLELGNTLEWTAEVR